jgi:hypothetical protein
MDSVLAEFRRANIQAPHARRRPCCFTPAVRIHNKKLSFDLNRAFTESKKASGPRAINLYRAFTESKNGFGLSNETIAFDIKDLARLYGPQRRAKP